MVVMMKKWEDNRLHGTYCQQLHVWFCGKPPTEEMHMSVMEWFLIKKNRKATLSQKKEKKHTARRHSDSLHVFPPFVLLWRIPICG